MGGGLANEMESHTSSERKVRNGPVNREDEPVALFTNLNFKRVVGCQVFWPLKLWYFVWYVLKTKDNKSCRLR